MADSSNRFQFTIKKIEALPFTTTKGERVVYYDTSTPGLILRVGEQSKTFGVSSRVKNGKMVKFTIGRYPTIGIDTARMQANILLGQLKQGVNPADTKKEIKAKEIADAKEATETVGWLLDTYCEEQLKSPTKVKVSDSTLRDLKRTKRAFSAITITLIKKNEKNKWVIDREEQLPDWLDRPLRSITKAEVLERFKKFASSVKSKNNGVITPIIRDHQLTFRYLKAAYNLIMPRMALSGDPNDVMDNPVSIIAAFRLWTNANVIERHIDKDDFAAYYDAILSMEIENSQLGADYIIVSLFQAGRSGEVANLTWDDINFNRKQIRYGKTKNGNDYLFPMTNTVHEILKRRFDSRDEENPYVFAQDNAIDGHIRKGAVPFFNYLKKKTGQHITHHDLRRTWTSASMEAKIANDNKIIDFCLKHTIQGVDKHYFIKNESAIREALQTVENQLLSYQKI